VKGPITAAALTAASVLALMPASAVLAQPQQPQQPQLTPLVAAVLSVPQAVLGSNGSEHLVYELQLQNITDGPFALRQITVSDEHGTTLAQLDEHAIAGRLSIGGRRGSESSVLGPSQFGVAFLHVTLAAGAPLPASLSHVIDGHSQKAGADFSIRGATTLVSNASPPSLSAPLHGDGYVAADGCCDSIRHVRALLPLDAGFHLAQRFAIDWEQVDASGRIFRGDPRSVRSYRIYGQPVYAVADGTVMASRNDLADQVPGKLPDGLPLDEADGNFAIIELAPGVYALYAHMRQGSVSVNAGSRVRRGEQIGNVGNTGNTSAPHLHLHLMDLPSALVANGIPYVFDSYQVTAVDRAGTADFDRAEATGAPVSLTKFKPPLHGQGSLPLDLSIVSWSR
jgi:hypothetical protein